MTVNIVPRVELDPNTVPRPARTTDGGRDSFDTALARVTHSRDRSEPRTGTRRTADRTDTREEKPNATEPQVRRSSAAPDGDGDRGAPVENPVSGQPAHSVLEDRENQAHGEGGPPRRVPSGKGTRPTPPAQSSPADGTATPARTSPEGAGPLLGTGVTASIPTHLQEAPVAQPPATIQRVTGSSVTELPGAGPKTPSRPGYRTMSPQLLRMAEQARDSVFKQVLFRVVDGTGEMRVLLDPPELGRLDLKMVVDKAGVMQLSILAERAEIALVLDKHMAELKSALAQHGLDVANAEVQHQEMGQRQHKDHGGGASADTQETQDPQAFQHRGYISAEGLDFWV